MNKISALVFISIMPCMLGGPIPTESVASNRSADAPRNFTDFDLGKLAIAPVEPKTETKSGFMVGGKNPTSLIKKLTRINGRTVAELENDMRPGTITDVGSTAGFLGPDEKLLDVLAADNRFVVDDIGLTHQELAKHLHALGAIGNWQQENGKAGAEFIYYSRRFTVDMIYSRGFQPSPFKDDTKSGSEATVRNLDNGKTLSYGLLLPYMIERYGFYEGKGTSYRLEPHAVVEVLDFLEPAPKKDGDEK